jgi:hypothetical protein
MGGLVTVELNDRTVCQVAHEALELLLTHNEITKIKRSNGWAVVGQDPLRNKGKEFVFSIPERRYSLNQEEVCKMLGI